MQTSRVRGNLRSKVLATVATLCLLGMLTGTATWSAFSSSTANTGNTATAGNVVLTDNDAGSALVSLSNATPGATDTGCIQVTYNGSLPAMLRLHGTTTGSGLDAYVDLTVTRGTVSSGAFDSCTNFTADATDYLGQGAGIVYNGTLAGWADDWDGGLMDGDPAAPDAWTAGETHAYKFQIALQNDDAAQGLTATQTFTWEARNLDCTASLTWLTGFESGVLSIGGGSSFFGAQATGGGQPVVDSAVKRNGAYALKVDKNSAGTSYMTISGFSTEEGVIRFAVRLQALPATDAKLVVLQADAGNQVNITYFSSSQKFGIKAAGLPANLGTTTVSAGQWYVIDLKVDLSQHIGDWQVDGVAQPQTTVDPSATSIGSVKVGSDVVSDVFTAHFDDIAASSTAADYPIGDGKVIGLVPNALGTSVGAGNFQDNDNSAIDATSYGRLDDQPLSGTSDWVKQVTISSGSYVEVAFADTAETCIGGVSGLLAYAGSGTGTNYGMTKVANGATESYVQAGAMNVTTLDYKSGPVAATGTGWTQAQVNGLTGRMGYASDVSPVPYWHGLMLEVAVGPAR